MTRTSFKREATISVYGPASPTFAQSLSIDQSHSQYPSSGDTVLDSSPSLQYLRGRNVLMNANTPNPLLTTNGTSIIGMASSHHGLPEEDAPLERLGRGVKNLVQAVQNLRHLGVEDLVLPLPKIVVVGDQSAGKSSLIEGISGIKVPRSAGTCTRCPLEINLVESENPEDVWKCEVYLHTKYMYDGVKGKGKGDAATRTRPLGSWEQLKDPTDLLFATLTSKVDVPEVLELAQLATLNPQMDSQRFFPDAKCPTKSNYVKFSPNVVRLDISGPLIPNLSFYDLPGVINQAEVPEEEYLVSLVQNLVKQYIKADNCVNLLAIPMTDDPANSTAATLVRKMKAEVRTLGVLTKPDRLQHVEDPEQWVKILSRQGFQLGFGYFVVKNNPDAQVEHALARRQEEEFFLNEEPWAGILREYKPRFGTMNLQLELSQRLTATIQSSLPSIADRVREKAESVQEDLNELPEPAAGNLSLRILEKILFFESQIGKSFEGGSEKFPFQKDFDNLAQRFRKNLTDALPKLALPCVPLDHLDSERSTPTPIRHLANAFTIIDSDEEVVPSAAPTPSQSSNKKRAHNPSGQSFVTPPKRRRMQEIPIHPKDSDMPKTFSLKEIREIIQNAHIGLPGQIDPKATTKMIKISLRPWNRILEDFLNKAGSLCETAIFSRVREAFGQWQQTPLFELVMETCGSFIDQALGEQRQKAQEILQWELNKPLIMNTESMELASQKEHQHLLAKRREGRLGLFLKDQGPTSTKSSGASRVDPASKVTDEQLGPDEYVREILAMATVRGYYNCARNRFVDVVCQAIHGGFLLKCRTLIAATIKEKIDIEGDGAYERCATLLETNPANKEKRMQLNKEKERLQKAIERLNGLSESDIVMSGV